MADSEQEGLADQEQERWKELHEVPFGDLSDAEITSKIKLSVKRRFDYSEWILMFEYGAPGNDGSVCDALAVNTLPSRNYKVVAFEFKASRSDWLRETRDGQKADYFVRLADEFYVVAPKDVVEESEIPEGWGYLELKPNSEQLYKLRDSDLTDHQQGEPGRRFWIRFLKQTVGSDSNYTQSDLQEARSRGYQDAKDEKLAKRKVDRDIDRLRDKADSWDRLNDRIGFIPWTDLSEDRIETLELAVALIRQLEEGGFGDLAGQVELFESSVERHVDRLEEALEDLDGGLRTLRDRIADDKAPEVDDVE